MQPDSYLDTTRVYDDTVDVLLFELLEATGFVRWERCQPNVIHLGSGQRYDIGQDRGILKLVQEVVDLIRTTRHVVMQEYRVQRGRPGWDGRLQTCSLRQQTPH